MSLFSKILLLVFGLSSHLCVHGEVDMLKKMMGDIITGDTTLCVSALCTDPLVYSLCTVSIGKDNVDDKNTYSMCEGSFSNTGNLKKGLFTRGNLAGTPLIGMSNDGYIKTFLSTKASDLFEEEANKQEFICEAIMNSDAGEMFEVYQNLCK